MAAEPSQVKYWFSWVKFSPGIVGPGILAVQPSYVLSSHGKGEIESIEAQYW